MGTTRLRANSELGWMDAIRQLVDEAASLEGHAKRIRITEDKLAFNSEEAKYKLQAALRLSAL